MLEKLVLEKWKEVHGFDAVLLKDQLVKFVELVIAEMPKPKQSSGLNELGKRLAALLNDEDWNYIEPFLCECECEAHIAQREVIAEVYEECAKVCEDDAKGWTDYSCEMAARDCADAIRALAEKAKRNDG